MIIAKAEAGYPLPYSPERLILIAASLDALWASLERAGYERPSLEEEIAAWRQYSSPA